MKEKTNKSHQLRWKSRFVRLTSMLVLCFNLFSAPLTAIGIATLAVATTALVVSCDKDDINQQQEPNQQQKHNVELVYGEGDTPWQNVALDTLYKYNSDPTVDTIFMIPCRSSILSTASTTGLQNVVKKLRERHNVNPNKIFGKGDIELKAESVQNNPEIPRFFADTLRHNVITR